MVMAAAVAVRAGGVIYAIDLVHPVVLHKMDHLGLADAYGRFKEMSGEVRYNQAGLEKRSMNFEVKAESIDTAKEDHEKDLRGPDFFQHARVSGCDFPEREGCEKA